MRRASIQRILGLFLMLFSLTMLPPALVSWVAADGSAMPFLYGFAASVVIGLVLWFPVRRSRAELKVRDGFLIVVLFWVTLGLFGALPFVLSPHLSFTDAIFESLSGLTTTGATVMVGLDETKTSILYYRQQLQWLGGMGIIVLAVAVLPMLGIGGMQLYRAETPGPMKDNKLTPRITETAKALWYIYLGLTVICAIAYWLAGMSGFDAIAHSFSTVAIGGFSTHDASLGYFDNPVIESIAIVFMLISGINFSLHFLAVKNLSAHPYISDAECKTYFYVLLIVSVVTTLFLWSSHAFSSFPESLRQGVFQVVSIGTTSGFTLKEYSLWPAFLPMLLLLVSFIGGCAGSTGGGMKVMRFLLLVKQGIRETHRLIHPNAMISVKIGKKALSDRVVDAVWGFFSLYVLCFCLMSLILVATGLDYVTSFSAVAACLNNLGPGLGEVANNYADINSVAKWVLCTAMLLGRLEVFSLFVLLTPDFWKK